MPKKEAKKKRVGKRKRRKKCQEEKWTFNTLRVNSQIS